MTSTFALDLAKRRAALATLILDALATAAAHARMDELVRLHVDQWCSCTSWTGGGNTRPCVGGALYEHAAKELHRQVRAG